MGGIRQGKDKASSVNEEDSIAKLAQHMYYQLLDEYNELEKKAKKKQTSKIKIQLQILKSLNLLMMQFFLQESIKQNLLFILL